MKILSIANQKGGVGKSTLTVHLAYAARERGLKVLLIDMDKQGSLSLTFSPEQSVIEHLVTADLYSEKLPEKPPKQIDDGFAILPADAALLDLDGQDLSIIKRVRKNLVERFGNDFDVCFIDTPPGGGLRLMGALAGSDFVVTPVQVGLYEIDGVGDLMQTIHSIRTGGFNARLRHIGILAMKTNNRSTDEKEGLAYLRDQFGQMMLDDTLPERSPVKRAIANRIPVWFRPDGESHRKAAQEWKQMCSLIIEKMGV